VTLRRRLLRSTDTQEWFTKVANGATESQKLVPQRWSTEHEIRKVNPIDDVLAGVQG
jgi:hypothetical protein